MKKQETWLITGGAGYIGSHIASLFIQNNYKIIVFDSLVNGEKSRIEYLSNKYKTELPLIIEDLRSEKDLARTFEIYQPTGVIHCAALKSVGESMLNAAEYEKVNVIGTRNVISCMRKFNVRKIINSSTAAVYGNPVSTQPIRESAPTSPISVYGETKLISEKCVTEFLISNKNYGTSLRFFNVVGAGAKELRDKSKDNLVPIVLDAIENNSEIKIFGDDYQTIDGTCIRDYVDVRDIARAHLLISRCEKKIPTELNIGTGTGISVKQVIETIKTSTSANPKIATTSRRNGDPSSLVANVDNAWKYLNFKAQFTFKESIESVIS